MVNYLVGIHAILGELGIFAFLWVFIELLSLDKKKLRRARLAALIGVVFFFLSWIIGGYYYSTYYGTHIKPVIKEGPTPWAHDVFMEAKEHIFLFLPFLGIAIYSLLRFSGNSLVGDGRLRKNVLVLAGIVVLLGLAMALMGYTISSGFRSALEAMHL